MVAEVIINSIAKELNRVFDYIVPDSLKEEVRIGSRVFVPFGNKKVEEAYIIGFKESSTFANKEIIKVADNILTEENITLAKLMARRYFCNISDSVKLMLPPGDAKKKIENRVKDKTGNFVYLKAIGAEGTKITEKQKRVLEALEQNDGIYIADLEALADVTKAVIKTLEKNGYVGIVEKKVERNPFVHKKIKRDMCHVLTEEQKQAFDQININEFKEFLLFGVTGARQNRNIFTTD
ncbi:MAG: hypothetical protein FWC79_01980 [Oscillospiraceae bacterium]|nr:hypothetical protein [Oscillospiraceae bacterium]